MSGTDEYKVGKGKPPLHTRFGAGNNANPAGKSKEQKTLEYRNAEAAMRIRERLLHATEARLVELSTEQVMELIEPAILKLITDSETRGLGAPKQALDHTSSDGTMTPKPGIDLSKAPPELLEWVVSQQDASAED